MAELGTAANVCSLAPIYRLNKMKSEKGSACFGLAKYRKWQPLVQNANDLWPGGISGRARIGFGWRWLLRGRGSPDLRNKVNIY